ncbi:unnamed protein product [Vitrella brassicaformis CCMP3155]|uniref:Apple domain-containing protein n=1 Tax=Vitrella brassicaformis (strain CCMP3155) TaxID=1169540 RepID=A0A0G4EC69_VITBC|nr:unnamed protein product [Vitrella brassicaformis CCMP3155]|eukprot:CEL93088.1 unnamed protein product [Vitrella brassicaformis CCMP3155]
MRWGSEDQHASEHLMTRGVTAVWGFGDFLERGRVMQFLAVALAACITAVHADTVSVPKEIRALLPHEADRDALPGGFSCYEWDVVYEGHDIEMLMGQPHMVSRPYDCARACIHDTRCNAWTWIQEGSPRGCLMKSSDEGRRPKREVESGVDTAGKIIVSGAKQSLDCDRGGVPSGCFERNVATLWYQGDRSGFEQGSVLSYEECHERCHQAPICTQFSWYERWPRDGKIVEGACFLRNTDRARVCFPGAIAGNIEDRDCGAGNATVPQPYLPPFHEDGHNMEPADPRLYYGLPTDPEARAFGRRGSKEERNFHRGDLGLPPSLQVTKPYAIRSSELRDPPAHCGCYTIGVEPSPNASAIVRDLPFASSVEECHGCVLHANVTKWVLDQVEPIAISGPRYCPEDLIEQGFRCDLDHYRSRFTSLSLLVLSVPNTAQAYGKPCPFDISASPFIALFIVVLAVLFTAAAAYQSRKRNGTTVIWRVMAAVLAALGALVHVVFVGFLFAGSDTGLLFWCGVAHLLLMIVFNECFMVWRNIQWVKADPFYRSFFLQRPAPSRRSALKEMSSFDTAIVDNKPRRSVTFHGTAFPLGPDDPCNSSGSVTTIPVEELLEFPSRDAEYMVAHGPEHSAIPVATESGRSNASYLSYCPSFAMSMLSDDTVWPSGVTPAQDQQEGRPAPIAEDGDFSRAEQQGDRMAVLPQPPKQMTTAPVMLSVPDTPSKTDKAGRMLSSLPSNADSFKLSSNDNIPPSTPTTNVPTTSMSAAGSLGKSSVPETHFEHHLQSLSVEGMGPYGGQGYGLVFVLFGSFFSISVLNLCWSHLWSLPFFAIPLPSDDFERAEPFSLVGTGPMLAIQLLTVFLADSGEGIWAHHVPEISLAAIVLSAANILFLFVNQWRRLHRRKGL